MTTPTAPLTTAADAAREFFRIDPDAVLTPTVERCVADLAAFLTTYAAQVRRAQWQDIATAPKDGTHVLLYRDDQGVFEGHYWAPDNDIEDGVEPIWWSVDGQDLSAPDLMPTHWQPLPSPPGSPSSQTDTALKGEPK